MARADGFTVDIDKLFRIRGAFALIDDLSIAANFRNTWLLRNGHAHFIRTARDVCRRAEIFCITVEGFNLVIQLGILNGELLDGKGLLGRQTEQPHCHSYADDEKRKRDDRQAGKQPALLSLRLQLPANDAMRYHAGQYVEFLLRDGARRSYSMANAPHTAGGQPGAVPPVGPSVELHIRHMPGGKFTDHVFGAMKEKEILRIEGPYGSFFLREDSDKPIVMLASGTGFALSPRDCASAVSRSLANRSVRLGR